MVLKILLKIMFDSREEKTHNNSHYRIMGVRIMEFILRELAKPILRRLGTVMGTALMSMGYAAEQSVAVETAATSLGLILIDLVLSNKERKKNV
jgi:uncharacterized membrane protein